MARLSIIMCALFVSIVCNTGLHAENVGRDCPSGTGCCRDTGRECPEIQGRCGKRRGDWYGARREVNSPQDAKNQISAYFAGQNVSLSNVTEKPWRFEADVRNRNGEIIDRVIIDRRSGRVRSIY